MSFRKASRLHLFMGSAVLALAATPAVARESATPARPESTVAPQTAAAATDETPAGDTQIAEVVVTATKRETNLQKTPIAINVLTAANLQERHVQSLYDLADGAVPSLRIATFEARQSALTVGIRGIVPLDANQPAREQGVGIYIDGIYVGRQHGLNAALYDLERVEVLKGPQGTLFGRNTEGGALSLVSKAPSGKFDLRATLGVSNYGGYNGDLHIDTPKLGDFAFKLDGVIQYQGATIRNPLAGQTGWNYFNRRGFRFATRWTPSSKFTADLATDIGYDANTPFYSQLLNYNPNGCVAGLQSAARACTLPGTNYTNLTGTVKPLLPGVVVQGNSRAEVADIGVPQQPSIDKTFGTSLTLKWKAADWIELRSITGYRQVSATQWDNSGGAHRVPVVQALPAIGATNPTVCTTAAPCAFSRYSLANLNQQQWSQEFQAVGTISRFDYVAGLYFFTEHVSDDAATPNSNGIVANTTLVGAVPTVSSYSFVILDPCIGSGGFGSQPGCRSIDRASVVDSRSYAAFGQVTWNPLDSVHITLGGRFTHDEKTGRLTFSRNVNYDNPANAAVLTAAGYQPLNRSWDRFNPLAIVAWDVTRDLHVYAKYATGYRAGGASSRTQNYQPFNPEDVKSYEIGMKWDLLDHRVRFNLAGYAMDRKNSQVDVSSIQPFNGSNFNNLVTLNAPGVTKIRGIEADLTVNPFRGLTLTASYAYTYTNIPQIPITYTAAGLSTTVFQQFYIVFTPRNAASGAIDYTYPLGDTTVKFHLDGNYSQATQAFDQFATKNDASLLFNGRVTLADIKLGGDSGAKLAISAWVRNLTNAAYIFRRDPSNSLPGSPTISVVNGNINNVLGDYGNYNAPRTFGLEASIKL